MSATTSRDDAAIAHLGAAPTDHAPVANPSPMLASAEGRRLVAWGPFARLGETYGVEQRIASLETDGATTAADVRWAFDRLDEHAETLDAELLLAPALRAQAATPYPVVRVAPAASEEEVVEAVGRVLTAVDPFERRQVVRGFQRVGRDDAVDALARDVAAFRVTGVFGLRRIGKTSAALAAAAALGEGFTTVYFDVQSVVRRDLDGVADALAVTLGQRLDRPQLAGIDPELGTAQKIEAIARALQARGRIHEVTPCLVVDEFDLLFANALGGPGIEEIHRLWDPLVAAVQRRALALMLVGRDPRRLPGASLRGYDGALAGLVSEHWLRPLTRAESETLLFRLGRRCGLQLAPERVREAYEMVGGSALLLRLYGRELRFEALGGPRAADAFLSAPDVRELLAGMLDSVARMEPECWGEVARQLRAGRSAVDATTSAGTLAALRRLGLLRDDGRAPCALDRLGPLISPVLEAEAA